MRLQYSTVQYSTVRCSRALQCRRTDRGRGEKRERDKAGGRKDPRRKDLCERAQGDDGVVVYIFSFTTYRLPLGSGVFRHASLFPSDVSADGDEVLGDDHLREVVNVLACFITLQMYVFVRGGRGSITRSSVFFFFFFFAFRGREIFRERWGARWV